MRNPLVTLLILVALIGVAHAVAAVPPNFLIVLADDLGFSDLGCYGGEISTPNLDALASHGLRYTQFYNTARCWPTRAALLTGYYAQQVGFDELPGVPRAQTRRRPTWAPLLPERLRPLGYRSYHSGKWHIDATPRRGGFDRSYSLLDFNHNFSPQNHTLDDVALPPVAATEGYYSTTAITDHAIQFLQEHAAEHAGQPFFTYVAFTTPHFPLQAPAEDIARGGNRYAVGWDVIRTTRWQRTRELLGLPTALRDLEPAIEPPYRFEKARTELAAVEVWNEVPWDTINNDQRTWQAAKMTVHAAMVERIDREVGRLIAELRTMNVLENTLVLFLSDNGASAEIMIRGDGHDPSAPIGSATTFACLGPGWSSAANTPFRRHKTWTHEGGIATPLIAHWPAGIVARGQLRHLTVGHVIDLAPTLVHLAGGVWPAELDGVAVPTTPGRNLASTFAHDESLHRELLWWYHEGNRAVRVGDWKLVAARDTPWELYDLATDRAETNNLATAELAKAQELAERWSATLREFQQSLQVDQLRQSSLDK